jgi:hypothetical protein
VSDIDTALVKTASVVVLVTSLALVTPAPEDQLREIDAAILHARR